MKYIILLMFAIGMITITGCSATFQAPAVCDGAESIILSATADNPTGLDKALLVVNLAALEKGVYTPDQAATVLDEIEGFIKEGVSYFSLKNFLDEKIAAASVLILGDSVEAIAQAGADKIISDCDKALILAHIENQRSIIALY